MVRRARYKLAGHLTLAPPSTRHYCIPFRTYKTDRLPKAFLCNAAWQTRAQWWANDCDVGPTLRRRLAEPSGYRDQIPSRPCARITDVCDNGEMGRGRPVGTMADWPWWGLEQTKCRQTSITSDGREAICGGARSIKRAQADREMFLGLTICFAKAPPLHPQDVINPYPCGISWFCSRWSFDDFVGGCHESDSWESFDNLTPF